MRPAFLIFKSFYTPIKALTDEELGQLFRAIFEYQLNPENPVGYLGSVGLNVKMAFQFFKNQFDLDNVKYQDIVDRNRENGLKGGRPRKPSGLFGNPENPVGAKKADIDKEIDKDNNILEIFELYLERSGNKEKLSPKRKIKIQARLKEFSLEDIRLAINNCFGDKFYSGDNERGWKANCDYIFRSYEVMERLVNLKTRQKGGAKDGFLL